MRFIMKCLICGKKLKSIGLHLRTHGLSSDEYKTLFDLHPKCKKCGKKVSRSSKNYCRDCVPRSGKDNPFYGKRHNKKTIETIKKKNSIRSKELWCDPVYREKVISGATGKKRSDEFKEKQRNNALKQFRDDKQRLIRSKYMKKSWEDGIITKNDNTSVNRIKAEKHIFNHLSKYYNVERGTLYLNNTYYFPDIIVNDQIIIEYYGDFWHFHPLKYNHRDVNDINNKTFDEVHHHDNNRINIFMDNGYYVFVIWEYDYKKQQDYILNQLCTNIDVLIKG
jgi:G:T-mismatch repair DNA endonuclease (very short patch repair protein)